MTIGSQKNPVGIPIPWEVALLPVDKFSCITCWCGGNHSVLKREDTLGKFL